MKLQINTKFNKTMQGAYAACDCSKCYDLSQLYNNASVFKWRAFRYLERLAVEHNAVLKLWGANCMAFSAGFEFVDDEGNLCFAYFTKDYTRVCLVKTRDEVLAAIEGGRF